MYCKSKIIPYTLQFKNPAGTSRGVYYDHKVWYILLTSEANDEQFGIGECAPLPDLSCDALPEKEYINIIQNACNYLEQHGEIDYHSLRNYSSILFGLETAWLHFQKKTIAFWDTPFSRGEAGIPINGLIWMGSYEQMFEQIKAKIESGFRCVKLKIGAIDFEKELDLLQHIRNNFSANEITLRVDANGAFSPKDALEKLERLAQLQLHSIEQPIQANQWEEMKKLTAKTPLPIALDEELIGCNDYDKKVALLETIKPQYIILKPSLHGGIKGCEEWIEIAEKNNIGWWITSALESNIGLNSIAQWCAILKSPLPQGLGTGMLYTNNIEMPLNIEGDCLWFDPQNDSLAINNIFFTE